MAGERQPDRWVDLAPSPAMSAALDLADAEGPRSAIEADAAAILEGGLSRSERSARRAPLRDRRKRWSELFAGATATLLADELRRAGVSTTRAFDDRSLKAQLRQADRSGARLAVIVGPDEEATGTVTLRSLRRDSVAGPGEADAAEGPGAEQRRVGRQDLLAAVSGWLR